MALTSVANFLMVTTAADSVVIKVFRSAHKAFHVAYDFTAPFHHLYYDLMATTAVDTSLDFLCYIKISFNELGWH